ncbi:Kelch repeat-containing protein [Actinocorallia lasiicapitis]
MGSREGHVAVWTGKEMVVWGGMGDGDEWKKRTREGVYAHPLVDGAAYDPATEAWRKIATGPLTARTGAVAVMTATTMFVWGGQSAAGRGSNLTDGAEYDPVHDSWTPLPPAPTGKRNSVTAVWTGTEVLLWGGYGDRSRWAKDGVAYDPAARTWRKIAAGPFSDIHEAEAVWTGRELVAIGAGGKPSAAVYTPATDTWRKIPTAGTGRYGSAKAVWIDGRVVARTFTPHVQAPYALDPATDRWSRLPSPKIPKNSWAAGPSHATPQGILSWDGTNPATRYTPLTGDWRVIPVPQHLPWRERGTVIWTGTDLIAFGGNTCGPLARCISLRTAHDALALRP